MPGTVSETLTVRPLVAPAPAKISFGAEVIGADLNDLSDSTFQQIKKALYENSVVVFKGQQALTPEAQFKLTNAFDPAATSYGHGKTLDAKKSILHPDLKTIPHQPQVQVIGNGFVSEYEGLKNITLKHPHHKTFHKTVIPEAEDKDFTRFYRWHIDAALYDLNPPKVTTLLAVKVPGGRTQTLRYDDGSDETMQVPLGTTAFVSGNKMYELLSEEQKEFVRTSKVEYAPHPYIWMSQAKSMSDGLGLNSEGLELPASELPPIDESKIKILPMCWKNPLTGELALQMHPSAVRKIHLKDGSVIEDLAEVRKIVHDLQRPAISPEHVYAHDWEEGDLVLFHNRGVLHSVVGAFKEDEVRIFRQCNVASPDDVEGPDA
jgi:xanthine dioxygenase